MQAGTNVQRPEKKSLNHLLNFQADHGKKNITCGFVDLAWYDFS